MFSSEDQEVLLRFIFSREENVECALGFIAAERNIRERIIMEFLERLKKALRERVGGLGASWKVVNELETYPLEVYRRLYIAKSSWNDLYAIGLSPQKGEARDFILGVSKRDQQLDGGRIRAVLQESVGGGLTSAWWPFYRWADPYRDWADPKTLRCFLGDRGEEAAVEIAESIVTIASAAENVIDEVVDGRRAQ